MQLHTYWFGTFLFDGDKPVEMVLFPEKPDEISKRLLLIEQGELLQEEKDLAKKAKMLQVSQTRLEKLKAEFVPDIRPILNPEDYGFDKSLLQKAMIHLAKEKMKSPSTPDIYIISAIRSIDDLVSSTNIISEHLSEWYGLHFPELRPLVNPEEYSNLIAQHGLRDSIIDSNPDLFPYDSIGADLDPDNLEPVRKLAGTIAQMQDLRSELGEYVRTQMECISPNLNSIVGPILGARLLSLAGGLERLSRMPSSTVQMLGAEKALFRHLRDGSDPPKHGVLFQHPNVHRAPHWQRGKLARAYASKISIAAKLDQYDAPLDPEIARKLEIRLESIRSSTKEPPIRKKSYHGRRAPARSGHGKPRGKGRNYAGPSQKHQMERHKPSGKKHNAGHVKKDWK